MAIVRINGVNVDISGADERGDPPNRHQTQLQQLVKSLNLVPPEHLKLIRGGIRVGERPPLIEHPNPDGTVHLIAIGGSDRRENIIRLHYLIFTKSWNRGVYNETVLHETGHIVDWNLGFTSLLRNRHPDVFGQLTSREYRGLTRGAGEFFGDAYKNYLLGHPSMAEREAMELTAFRWRLPFRPLQ